MTLTFTAEYLDACMPGFFQGYPHSRGFVLCCAVTGSDRVWQVREGIEDDLSAWDGWLATHDRQCTDEEGASIAAAVSELFADAHPLATCFPDMPLAAEYADDNGEIEETPYCYVGIAINEGEKS